MLTDQNTQFSPVKTVRFPGLLACLVFTHDTVGLMFSDPHLMDVVFRTCYTCRICMCILLLINVYINCMEILALAQYRIGMHAGRAHDTRQRVPGIYTKVSRIPRCGTEVSTKLNIL